MFNINPEIPLSYKGGQSSLDQMSNIATLADLLDKRNLRQRQISQEDAAMALHGRVQNILRQPGAIDPNTGEIHPQAMAMVNNISPEIGQSLMKEQNEQMGKRATTEKTQAEVMKFLTENQNEFADLLKKQAEYHQGMYEQASAFLDKINDPETYRALRPTLIGMHIPENELPESIMPEDFQQFKELFRARSITRKDQYQKEIDDFKNELAKRKQTEEERHNVVGEKIDLYKAMHPPPSQMGYGNLTKPQMDDLAKLEKSVETVRSTIGLAKQKIMRAEALETLINAYGTDPKSLNNLDQRQKMEVALSLQYMLSPGQQSEKEVHGLIPKSIIGDGAKALEWLTNNPTGTQQGKFMHRIYGTVLREKETSKDQVMREIYGRVAAYPRLKGTQELNDWIAAQGLNVDEYNQWVASGMKPISAVQKPEETKIPSPKTKEEYDKISSGSVYIDTDGIKKRKK